MKQTTDFLTMKQTGEKITMLTAYDYPTAKLAEKAGIDVILVGDSLGMVVLGYDSTMEVTTEDMIHHTKAVKRGAKNTFIITDMPFATAHYSKDKVMKTAVKIMQEGGAHAVKIEGTGDGLDIIEPLTDAGIPVCAHIGLTPQSVGVLGGYKVQGKSLEDAKRLIEDAKKAEEKGAFMLVVECVPYQLTERITKELEIPVIGIGAGQFTDGQVLVFHDTVRYGVCGLPKFVKSYANIQEDIVKALKKYRDEVKAGIFPDEETSYTMKEDVLERLHGGIAK